MPRRRCWRWRPAGHSPTRKGKTYPVEILTPDEIRDLAAQCSTTTSVELRHRALIVLLYRTGLRIREALALHPKDVNLEIGSVVVLHGKGNRQRTVGIDRGANPHIEAWLERRDMLNVPAGATLFCTMKGTPLAAASVSQRLHKLADRAGIEKRVHRHGFRHTHAYEFFGALQRSILVRVGEKQAAFHLRVLLTDEILEEMTRSVQSKDPDFSDEQARNLRAAIRRTIPDCLVEDYECVVDQADIEDMNDRRVVSAGIHAKAHPIMTGDMGFTLTSTGRTVSVTPFAYVVAIASRLEGVP